MSVISTRHRWGTLRAVLSLFVAMVVLVATAAAYSPSRAAAQEAAPAADGNTDAVAPADGATNAATDVAADPLAPQADALQAVAALNANTDADRPIEFSNPTLVMQHQENFHDGFADLWSWTRLNLDWKAPNGVKAGQTFSLTLPTSLQANANTFNLVDSDNVVGANCAITPRSGANPNAVATCTFNDAFEGKDNVHGTLHFDAQLTQKQESGEFPVDIKVGDNVSHQTFLLTDTTGVKIGRVGQNPRPIYADSSKWGEFTSTDSSGQRMSWQVTVGTNVLKKNPTAAITFTDTLSGNHQYDVNRWKEASLLGSDRIPGDKLNATFEFAADNKSMTVTVQPPAGGWPTDKNLMVYYGTIYTGEGAAPTSETFSNKIEGLDRTVSKSISRANNAGGTITGVDRGSFELHKSVVAKDGAQVPADTAYTVKVTIDASKSVNPGFAFTETAKVPGATKSGSTITYTDTIKADGVLKGYDSLPKGTVVTITELDAPKVDGVAFEKPVFASDAANVKISDDKQSATITIGGETASNTVVALTNTAKPATGSLSFSKNVANNSAGEVPNDTKFKINLTWTDAEGKPLTGEKFPASIEIVQGKVTTLDGLPAGTHVAFAEDTTSLPKLNGLVWGAPTYKVSDNVSVTDKDQEAVVAAGATGTVKVTNTFTPSTDVEIKKVVTGSAAFKVSKDHEFQVKATWLDESGAEQTRMITVTPNKPASLTGLPLGVPITLEESGAAATEPNLKWGDVIWSADSAADEANATVNDEPGQSRSATVTLTGNPGELVHLKLENQTSANGLIIIPLLIPLIPMGSSGGSSVPPLQGSNGSSQGTTTAPTPSTAANQAPVPSAEQKAESQPAAKGKRLAMTGANLLAPLAAALLLVTLGAIAIKRSRRN